MYADWPQVSRSLASMRFVRILFLFLAAFFLLEGIAAETENDSKSWIVRESKTYREDELSRQERQLLKNNRPRMEHDQRSAVDFQIAEVHKLVENQFTFYAVSYFGNPDPIGTETPGLLLITRNGTLSYRESNPNISPIARRSALLVVRSQGKTAILLRTHEILERTSGVAVFDTQGRKTSAVTTKGNAEYFVFLHEKTGALVVRGYDLEPAGSDSTKSQEIRSDLERLASEMRVKSLAPFLSSAKVSGLYRAYYLDSSQMLVPARGQQWKELYLAEALRLLPAMKELASSRNREQVVDGVLLFMGVLEGMADRNLMVDLFDRLPRSITSNVDPRLAAKFWAAHGFPQLLTAFN